MAFLPNPIVLKKTWKNYLKTNDKKSVKLQIIYRGILINEDVIANTR
jgi:hypothetical protein